MVTHADFPSDIRIEKEADVLSRAGHEITVFTPLANDSLDDEPRLRVIESGSNLVPMARFVRLRRLLKQCRIDLVHLQDTPGSIQALLAARSLGLNVIYDMHEIWPALVIDNSQGLTYKDALWSASLRGEEAFALNASDLSLTVVEEALDYLERKYKRRNRIFSIRNFETVDRFRNIRPSPDFANKDEFLVTYVGGLDGPIRGIQDVILAAAQLTTENVQFLIVGSGAYSGWLQLLARKLHLEKSVRFLGARRFVDAMAIVAASDVCLVPHKNCLSTRYTLPHKISQYMALQKPVIASNLTPISRLFQSAFIRWEPRTPERLAELIASIRENRAQADEIARMGYRLVSERCSWKEEGRKLVALYESLAPK